MVSGASAAPKAAGTGKSRRVYTPAQVVDKKIKDSLKDMSPAEIDLRKNEHDRTARQQILHDYLLSLQPKANITFGQTYYNNIRKVFKDTSDPYKQLDPPEPLESVREPFEQAVDKARDPIEQNRKPLLAWLQVRSSLNRTETCGFLRFCLSLRAGCQAQLADVHPILKFVF